MSGNIDDVIAPTVHKLQRGCSQEAERARHERHLARQQRAFRSELVELAVVVTVGIEEAGE